MIFAIMVALLFLMAPVGAAHSQGIAASPPNFQPNVSLNTNITWSNFYSGYNPLEYNNGTGNATLQTNTSTFYKNSISINPMNIQAPGILQNDNISGSTWQNASRWNLHGAPAPGEVQTVGLQNGQIYVTGNTSDSGSGESSTWISLTPSTLPSTSLQYDYFTFALKFSASAAVTGETAEIDLGNATGAYDQLGSTMTPGQVEYVSVPLSALDQSAQKFNFNQNTWTIQINTDTPTSATASVTNASISALAISENPLYLGLNNNGTNTIERYNNTGTGTIALTNFSPDFAWSKITDNGYTVATSQHLSQMENYSTIKTPISSGNYVEQVGYSGDFHLPTAPDLSYTGTNLSIGMNVPGKQIQVMDINGESYLNMVQNKTNGTIALISGLNPTTHISYLEYVNYTYSQWNSISSPPGAFSIAGIEYYYWIAIGAVAGLIGLGAASHRANVKGQQLRGIRPPRGR